MPTKTYMNRLKVDNRSRANHIFVTPFALTSECWVLLLVVHVIALFGLAGQFFMTGEA